MSNDILVLIEHVRGQVADISYVMLAAARVLAQGSGGDVTALLLGSGVQNLASDLAADSVWYMDHPALADFASDAYQRALGSVIEENAPRAVLFGDTSIGGEVAALLAAQFALPLVSAVRYVSAENGVLKSVSQICGGKIMAEGELPAPTALITMIPGGFKAAPGHSANTPAIKNIAAPRLDNLHISVKRYVEPAPGDVDIAHEKIIVSVGRGIQSLDNIGMAEELAAALGGVVCASRPVIDQNWLPATRQIGKSGKAVKAKMYLALGISGAPEHSEAISDSDLIVAVNTDPNAPIFDIAHYGAQVDILELMPVLTEKVNQAKQG